jgi:hypothetical protein
MQIIRNISTEQRFFEIINSMPNPTMNLYSGYIFGTKASTIAEAINKNGICLYRHIVLTDRVVEFEKQFKFIKKELNA